MCPHAAIKDADLPMKANILVVDDEQDILKTLENALKLEGYRVFCADCGTAALEICRQQSVDLVITDVRMPDMDGLEVISRLKEMDPNVEAIVLTGYAALENAIAALRDAGAFDYLTKPLENIDTLFLTVRKGLERRQLKLENRSLVSRLEKKEAELLRKNRVLLESEKKYRELAEFLPVALFETDREGRVTFLNPHALESFQYTREDMIKGLQIQNIVGQGCWEKIQRQAENMEAVKPFEAIEMNAMRKGGSTFPVLTKMCPVFHDGRLTGIMGMSLDITDRKRRFDETMRLAKLESLGTLAAGITHDFNNILSVILWNIELARFDVAPETPAGEALENAVEGCAAASELTERFITFSERGVPKKETIAMGPFLEGAVPILFSGSNVDCQLRLSEGLWSAHVDQGLLSQAIHNVVKNAIEAMPAGGTVIFEAQNIEIRDHDRMGEGIIPKGRYVKMEIRDQGKGIPAEHLKRVLDPYFSTKDRGAQKGMGLGLSTAYSIVKKHDGFMFLSSKTSMGTTVSIYLPAGSRVETEIRADVEPDHVPASDVSLKDLKILFMEDEKMLRDSGRKILQQLGYEVETARNGREAVEMYKAAMAASDAFDLVLLDLTVKGGPGGKAAIKELLKVNPNVKAVVCSGYVDDPAMSDFEAYGFRAALPKPFSRSSLEAAVRKASI